MQGDRVLEYAVAELLEEGQIQRYIRRIKRIYAERRNVDEWIKSRSNHAQPPAVGQR